MTIEPEPFEPIRPNAETDAYVSRRLGGASWLTTPPAAPPPLAVPPGEVEQQPLQHQPVAPCGIFVDFAGYEDLLEEFGREAAKAGLSPSESVFDLVYLFMSGDLCFKADMQ